ncbi:MAG: hypothetical protein QOJ61_2892, partial [Mycobacterium sp.]|nr:hypothetical protein [Mycobacterium sp.]
ITSEAAHAPIVSGSTDMLGLRQYGYGPAASSESWHSARQIGSCVRVQGRVCRVAVCSPSRASATSTSVTRLPTCPAAYLNQITRHPDAEAPPGFAVPSGPPRTGVPCQRDRLSPIAGSVGRRKFSSAHLRVGTVGSASASRIPSVRTQARLAPMTARSHTSRPLLGRRGPRPMSSPRRHPFPAPAGR